VWDRITREKEDRGNGKTKRRRGERERLTIFMHLSSVKYSRGWFTFLLCILMCGKKKPKYPTLKAVIS